MHSTTELRALLNYLALMRKNSQNSAVAFMPMRTRSFSGS